MDHFESFKKHLPSYLSAKSEAELYEELKSFPHNIDQRMYANVSACADIILQGDCFRNLSNGLDASTQANPSMGLIISNTCDLSKANKRDFGRIRMCYTPVFPLKQYQDFLLSKLPKVKVDGHIKSLKEQKISQIFFVPKGGNLHEDSFAKLDQIVSMQIDDRLYESIIDNRIFSMSNYGFYLFIFKISVHFTRIREGIDRAN